MTPEEAIRIIEVAKAECEWNALEYQEAFDAAISALAKQDVLDKTVGDLISRSDAIDIINVFAERFNRYIGTPNDSEVYAYARGLLLSIESDIRALPSAQQWIPCSEREPDEDGQYIITVKYRHVDGRKDIYAEHGVLRDRVTWDVYYFGHCDEVERVLAWMPLPEPYKE